MGWLPDESMEIALQWDHIARASGTPSTDFHDNRISLQWTLFF